MSFSEEKKINTFFKKSCFHIFLAALTTLKQYLPPSTVIIHQSPIGQCFFRKDLLKGPHELGLAGGQLAPAQPRTQPSSTDFTQAVVLVPASRRLASVVTEGACTKDD